MKEPISERIAVDIFGAVSGITQDAGCYYTINAERLKTPENIPEHLKAVVVDTDPERQAAPQSQGRSTVERDYAIETYFMPDKGDEIPLGTHLNRLHADITKAVCKDHRRGGLAIKTTVIDPEIISNADGAIIGISVNFTILYRYKTSDPSSL